MSVIFRQVNFLNFVNILKEKWSIFSGGNSVCNSEFQDLINEDNFWQKLFCKIINATTSFHKKKYFFDTHLRSDIFWYGKKIHDFCSKIHNSKNLENTKKIFASWKSLEYQLSNDIRFSTQTQEMIDILLNEKNL